MRTSSMNNAKKTEENSRMAKTRDLFRKTGKIKGTFSARMDTIKDRDDEDLTERLREHFLQGWIQ